MRIHGGSSNKSQPPPGKSISDVSRRAEGSHSRMELFVMKVRGRLFAVILPHTLVQLPDMEFPINAKAEGQVLVPWEHRVYPNLTVQAMLGGPFKPDCGTDSGKPGNGHVTPKVLLSLISSKADVFTSKHSNYLKAYSTTPTDDLSLAFKTVAADIDFCNSSYALYSQGHFFWIGGA